MSEVSFKERVRREIIAAVRPYKENFVDYEYLLCSGIFSLKDYYIINAHPDNYQHLTGVHSLINAQEFFDKCYCGLLQETDFDFIKRGQSEKEVKGSVRRKISVLTHVMSVFQSNFIVQESFVKNRIYCSVATADEKCTLGFSSGTTSQPKSLLKGNELDLKKSGNIDLLLRKRNNQEKFNELLVGDMETLRKYDSKVGSLVDKSII